jgi:hypothetical protein
VLVNPLQNRGRKQWPPFPHLPNTFASIILNAKDNALRHPHLLRSLGPLNHNPLGLPCPTAARNLCRKQAAGLNPAAAAQAAAIAQQAAAAQVVTALQHSSGPRSGSGATAAGVKLPAGGPDIAREVVINDAGHHIRQLLTKRQTLDEISKRTNTQLVVRGRFVPGGSQNASGTDRPLYLRVTPTTNAGQVCVRLPTWVTGNFVGETPQHRIMSCWLHGLQSCRCSI